MKPYHNEGFGLSFLAIVFFMLVFHAIILFTSMGTWDTFVKMHIPDGECWENAKHERVCKQTVKYGAIFVTRGKISYIDNYLEN